MRIENELEFNEKISFRNYQILYLSQKFAWRIWHVYLLFTFLTITTVIFYLENLILSLYRTLLQKNIPNGHFVLKELCPVP